MLHAGDVISYFQMCAEENVRLRRGMNFRIRGQRTVILMNLNTNAPYADQTQDNSKILIYEGHDAFFGENGPAPKTVDQPMYAPSGSLTQNGLFFQAVEAFKRREKSAEIVYVYEKIKTGIWVYNGQFKLVDAWQEKSENRNVFKFRLEIIDEKEEISGTQNLELEHTRMIPSIVKLEVWKRDKGKCVKCGSTDNLHFDHIIPFSKGGTSLTAENIQLLCARHNLEKRDKIE